MRKLVISSGLAVILHLSALGQVDTLQLHQVRSINFPEPIRNIYFADLLGDSLTEMVVGTANHVYIYNMLTDSILWTSPQSYYNDDREPAFCDMNHDGDLDIAFKDTSGLHIYDFVHSVIIWDGIHVFGSYALGDRNSDDIEDVVNVRRGPYNQGNEPDTAYIEIYDGPSYQLSAQSNFSVVGFHPMNCNSGDKIEGISKVIITHLTGSSGLYCKIVIFSTINYGCYQWTYPPDLYCNSYMTDGNVMIVDPITLQYITISSAGQTKYSFLRQDSVVSKLYLICQISSSSSGSLCADYFETTKYLRSLSAEGELIGNIIYYNSTDNGMEDDWQGFLVNDINYANQGNEICFGNDDYLWLYSFPDLRRLWSRQATMGNEDFIKAVYHSNLFSHSQILVQPYFNYMIDKLYSGSTGELTGVIRGYSPMFNAVTDIDNDGEDELIILDAANVNFYNLEYVFTDIHENIALPSSSRLYPNYPNPFNASTTIEYDLIKSAQVIIAVYDVLGRNVATLVGQNEEAGHHKITWKAGDLSSGIYFYKITAGDFSESKRMLFNKIGKSLIDSCGN